MLREFPAKKLFLRWTGTETVMVQRLKSHPVWNITPLHAQCVMIKKIKIEDQSMHVTWCFPMTQ